MKLRLVRVIARLNVGGPARHVLVATQRLAPWFDTTLAAGDVGPGETEAASWIREHGVTVMRIPGLGRAVSIGQDLRAFRELRRLLREVQPHILHTHTAKAGFLGRLAARTAPVGFTVHTFHGHVFDGTFGAVFSRVLVWIERYLAKRTDVIVAVSAEVERDLVDRFAIAPREKVRVIPLGIPLDAFLTTGEPRRQRRSAVRKELGIGEDAPVIGWCGRLVPVKDPHLALAAFAVVRAARPDAVLIVAGDGPMRRELEAAAPASSGVRFLGVREDMAGFWAAADLALLTSRSEGTPVALIEAAASQVPAVATRVGGVASVVDQGVTGLLVPHGDHSALAAAMIELLGDSPRRSRMGRDARARATERFSEARLVRDLRTLYASLAPPVS